jgi:hypothetical protein
MLIQNADGPRRFDVRSYRSFVAAELHPEGDDKEWLTRLDEVTDDLDVESDPVQDARIEQLRQVYSAVATLILRFHDAEPALSAVGERTLESATKTSGRTTTRSPH